MKNSKKPYRSREARAPELTQAQEDRIAGRNPVMEALRSEAQIDTVYVSQESGGLQEIVELAKSRGIPVKIVTEAKLSQLTGGAVHQGVAADGACGQYVSLEDLLKTAEERGEPPLLVICDGIQDPHNLGAIIRTANLASAHGVIIPKRRAVGLTATVARTSAGALNYTPVAKVTNLNTVMEELKKEGLWFVCADMGGETMYRLNLTGPIGLVIGNEGDGVSKLVKEHCDMVASIPMKGDIDSLNASVAAGVLAYEIVRQRMK